MTDEEKEIIAQVLGLVLHKGELCELAPAKVRGYCDDCALFDMRNGVKDCGPHLHTCGPNMIFIKWEPKP